VQPMNQTRGNAKHFSHTPNHNPLFTSTSTVQILTNLHASYNLQIQLPLTTPVLYPEPDEGISPTFDTLNGLHDEILSEMPRPPPSTPTASEEPEDIIEDTSSEDLNLVINGMEGLSAIEICEVEPFPPADSMVLSGVHPVEYFN